MRSIVITEAFVTVALGVIMLSIGLSLTVQGFRRVVVSPKATVMGPLGQLELLPVVAFLMLKVKALPEVSCSGQSKY